MTAPGVERAVAARLLELLKLTDDLLDRLPDLQQQLLRAVQEAPDEHRLRELGLEAARVLGPAAAAARSTRPGVQLLDAKLTELLHQAGPSRERPPHMRCLSVTDEDTGGAEQRLSVHGLEREFRQGRADQESARLYPDSSADNWGAEQGSR